MYCRHCGKEIPDTAMFCRFCGTKIAKIAPAAPAPQPAEAQPAQPVCPVQSDRPVAPAVPVAPAQQAKPAPAPAQTAPGTDSTLIPNQPIDQSAPPVTVEEGLYPWMQGEARTFHEQQPAPRAAAQSPSPQAARPLDFDPMQHPYLKGVSREEAMIDPPFEPQVNEAISVGGDQSFTSMEVHHEQPAKPAPAPALAKPAAEPVRSAPAQPAAKPAPTPAQPAVEPAQPAPAMPKTKLEEPEVVIEPAPTLGPVEVEETPNPFTAFDEVPTMPAPPDPNADKK